MHPITLILVFATIFTAGTTVVHGFHFPTRDVVYKSNPQKASIFSEASEFDTEECQKCPKSEMPENVPTLSELEKEQRAVEYMRRLEATGVFKFIEDSNARLRKQRQEIQKPKNQHRLCGRVLVDKIATLCLDTCTEDYDISTVACAQGLTDSQLIANCCPTSYRDQTLPKTFVF